MNFSLFSRRATGVTLCLYDRRHAGEPSRVIPLKQRTHNVWHVFVPDLRPGQLYGYRVDGPFDPSKGLFFNPHKLLLDPYAKAITHKSELNSGEHFPFVRTQPQKMDMRANDAVTAKCVVVDDAFDWQGVKGPRHASQDLVIYEIHVKGFTAHPSAQVGKPGTYLGFVERLPYLRQLGVNAVELLPIHESVTEQHLLRKELTNYWGYSTVGFFAPDSRFAAAKDVDGAQVNEMKTLVRECHRHGIEVILDVVYNHTGEEGPAGPMLCFRGIDNPTYYKLDSNNLGHYRDYTGCGNSVNAGDPIVVRMIMDSLRYWVTEYHIDGFRFDLATTLGRTRDEFDAAAPLFAAMEQEPLFNHVRLIAEPWDVGPGGYRLGHFLSKFHEWNGHYREVVRKFVRGDEGQLAEMGFALTGSSELFGLSGRAPYQSINYVTTHDGFTLWDLVSYDGKHNEANGEDNRDGEWQNYSHNWGVEGATKDPEVLALRQRAVKNFMAVMMLSHGTPMVVAGDEFGRTQRGNNNAYCQDNELTWLDYRLAERYPGCFRFLQKLIEFRMDHPVLRKRHFVNGQPPRMGCLPDILWFDKKGNPPDWHGDEQRFLAYLLDGCAHADEADTDDADMLIILNMESEPVDFPLPSPPMEKVWADVLDTSKVPPHDFRVPDADGYTPYRLKRYIAAPFSVALLMSRPARPEDRPRPPTLVPVRRHP
ncbi:MAG: glycogen debranching protein GlgX [Deltaproteobacteria bacterium]|nr:glycogen debranching protein GlgX [Deltaproteobacteria bacterium]